MTGDTHVWIVWCSHSDGSGEPTFLAAYDGEEAKQRADELMALLEKASPVMTVRANAVPLYPIHRGLVD